MLFRSVSQSRYSPSYSNLIPTEKPALSYKTACARFVSQSRYGSNDVNEIRALHVRQLVRELMIMFPELKNLKQTLNSHVRQLSKQADYLLAADSLIDSIGFLYTLRDDGHLPPSFLDPEGLAIAQKTAPFIDQKTDHDTIPHRHNLKYLTNLFDLRADISRNISPLHAKILLISSVLQVMVCYYSPLLTLAKPYCRPDLGKIPSGS